jgi:outer membrane protein TolC
MSEPNSPPDLDLIARVQAARRQFDAVAQPSQVHAVYWIEASRETDGPGPTPRAGAWVIGTTSAEIDGLWARIRAATREGALGYKARALTAPRTGGPANSQREIHVVTYDADDTADVERVRAALVGLGVMPVRYART